MNPIQPQYPTAGDVDNWSGDLLQTAESLLLKTEKLGWEENPMASRHCSFRSFIRFQRESACGPFFGCWQPAYGVKRAPLLVHFNGYGGEYSIHPHVVSQGYHVLHVNPQGYLTPGGFDKSKWDTEYDDWPVLPDTIRSLGKSGYREWLLDALCAIRWATSLPEVDAARVGLFGTSQGGGASLLLGSILGPSRISAVAADLPFLTHFPLSLEKVGANGAYRLASLPLKQLNEEDSLLAWRNLGFIDTISHAHRLVQPVLLTLGKADTVCPPESIRELFKRLPGSKSLTELHEQEHGFTVPFLHLTLAWMRLYV